MAAALYREIPITEYAPRKVKQSVTGNGNTSKESRWRKMLMQMFNLKDLPKMLDATDALAVAVCHHNPERADEGEEEQLGEFVKENPGRLKVKVGAYPAESADQFTTSIIRRRMHEPQKDQRLLTFLIIEFNMLSELKFTRSPNFSPEILGKSVVACRWTSSSLSTDLTSIISSLFTTMSAR